MKIKIEKSETAGNKPTNRFVIADLSYSMYGSIRHLKDTLLATKDIIGPEDTISIGWFSSRGEYGWLVKGMKITDQNFTKLINEKFYARNATCYNEILGSLVETVEDVVLATGNNNNSLMFLSDGNPNDGHSFDSLMRVCKNIGTKSLFNDTRIIGFDRYYNRELLISMAEAVGGQFSHISDHFQFDTDYKTVVTNKVETKVVDLSKKYDLIWQVTDNDVLIYKQNDRNQVVVQATKENSELLGVDLVELNDVVLDDPRFVYSLAAVLAKANKSNLGVNVLRRAGDYHSAYMLQKAFTVDQKGRAENQLIAYALTLVEVNKTEPKGGILLKDWIKELEDLIAKGEVAINTQYSEYRRITGGKEAEPKVKFEYTDGSAKIVDIKGNEDRPNITLLTNRKGQITEILDPELKEKVDLFNDHAAFNESLLQDVSHSLNTKQITLPFQTERYKNYTLVSDGDFNFDSLVLNVPRGTVIMDPRKEIELFDPETKTVDIKEFVNLNKTLIKTKAHVSVLNWYIKNNAETKQREDLRLKWGPEGAALLEEMGLDYQLRYTPPRAKEEPKNENSDYVEHLEIDCFIKGCSKISAKDSYEKKAKGKAPNELDTVMWPLFEKYDQMLTTLKKDLFVKAIQTELEGLTKTVKVLSQEVASQKFYLFITNSWFEGQEKADTLEVDSLMIKTKYTKEYL